MLPRFIFFIGGVLLPAHGAETGDPLATLKDTEVQELLPWLSSPGSNPPALSREALNRAALRGLLNDGSTGAVLLAKAEAVFRPAPPSLLARLGDSAAYVRPGGLDETALAPVSAFLGGLPPGISVLVLDLRVPLPPGPLARAAALTSLLLPPELPLFQVLRGKPPSAETCHSQAPRVWNRRVWLLVDDTTPPVLELAARILVRHNGALTLGTPTRGILTETTDRPLGPEHILRLPSGTVAWPDGNRPDGMPLEPEIRILPAPESRAALLALTDPGDLEAWLTETSPPRPNEAALMQGLPAELAAGASSGSTSGKLRPDPVLQQAQDLILTTRFLKVDAPDAIPPAGPGR